MINDKHKGRYTKTPPDKNDNDKHGLFDNKMMANRLGLSLFLSYNA